MLPTATPQPYIRLNSDHKNASPTVLTAFAIVYLVWGSTYLAIRVAVETIPPYLMTGIRFSIAGSVMYGWLRLRGVASPSTIHWRNTAVIGVMMLTLGVGSVGWAEQTIDSGVAALLVATVPLWISLLEWIWKRRSKPHPAVFLGLFLGFFGVFLLFDPEAIWRAEYTNIWPLTVVVIASFFWSIASVHSHSADLPDNPFLATSMEMCAGGVALLAIALFRGEIGAVSLADVTNGSILSLAYLIVMGSFLAFSAYIWLLKHVSPTRVATYAYVNPGVAVILGAIILNEQLSGRIFGALALLIISVILINRYAHRD